jgi:hypothetical protein
MDSDPSDQCENTLPLSWCSVLEQHTANTDDNHLPKTLELLPCTDKEVKDPLAFLIPPVVLWSPLESYRSLHITCHKCDSHLTPKQWVFSGSPYSTAIRTIHGISSPTLVISRIYKCQGGHLTPGHHPSILNEIPSEDMIPFKLSHRSGFTNELALFIYQLTTTSISLRKISEILQEKRQLFYLNRRRLYEAMNTESSQSLQYDDWKNLFSSHQFTTSHSVIAASYIHTFQTLEKYYEKHMCDLSLDNDNPVLSCDHTFKSAGG